MLAVGNPFGLGGTVTAGIVSARGRDIGAGPYDDFLQIDAPVNQGNSGGPTFDVEGNVIGVNTAIVSPSGGSVGIGFAIPAETVKSVIAQLKDKGKVTRGWIGVQIQSITPEIAENLGLGDARGALVAEPDPSGPAKRAGIDAGDIITAVNGKHIADSRELARTISAMPPGSSVKLTVVRKGQEKIVTVTLGELPDQREAALSSDSGGTEGREHPAARLHRRPEGGQRGRGRDRCGCRRNRCRVRLEDRRRHPRRRRQEARHCGRPARCSRGGGEERQAHGADAGEVRHQYQICDIADRPGMTGCVGRTCSRLAREARPGTGRSR